MRDSTERRRLEYVRDGQAAVLDRLLDVLSTRPHREEPIRQTLAMTAELLRADWVCLLIPSPEGEDPGRDWRPEILHFAAGEAPPAVISAGHQASLISATALWQEMARTRWPVVVEDCASDERITVLPEGVSTLILAPMLLAGEAIGALCIAGENKRHYLPEEVELAQALAQLAALALQLRRLGEQEQRNAVLAERNRIAREIHDTLAQSLTGILLHLETAEWEVVDAPQKALVRLAQSRELAKQGLAEARRSVWALHPGALEDSSLSEALQRHMDQADHGAGSKKGDSELRIIGEPRPLPPDVEANLLRIGIEAITNVFKHAETSCYSVELAYEPEIVRLSVTDSGKGFALSSLENDDPLRKGVLTPHSGFGLIAMRDRAERIGGRLHISSRPGAGVQVTAVAPTSATGMEQVKTWTK
jgi:signal transduction histidine kinase